MEISREYKSGGTTISILMKKCVGNSDHNQIHFDINVKSESKNKILSKARLE